MKSLCSIFLYFYASDFNLAEFYTAVNFCQALDLARENQKWAEKTFSPR